LLSLSTFKVRVNPALKRVFQLQEDQVLFL
jgi:hypothetical protein